MLARDESAEVDDPADPGGAGRPGEVLGGGALAGGERAVAVRRLLHRVDQEVGDVDPVERLGRGPSR